MIRFNAVDMNYVAHQIPGPGKPPDNRSRREQDLKYWTEPVKLPAAARNVTSRPTRGHQGMTL
ncbi:hypothetical protein AU197_11840 [Mycobacterium sp. IS-1590]|nr:hypothetical protein AU197_11840 [Mycobacterium sp. IS-1590]